MTDQVWGIALIKDEAEIIEYQIRHLFAEGVDGIVVADNLSTDDTHPILLCLAQEYPNLLVMEDTEINFWQSRKLTGLAHVAAMEGATWILPFDADEMYYAMDGQPLAESVRAQTGEVLAVKLKNYLATSQDDPLDLNPLTREQWRQAADNPLDKVCFRWSDDMVIQPGNHSVHSDARSPTVTPSNIAIAHFQNRTPEHFIRKIRNEARAYRDAGLSAGIGYWWKFGHLTDAEIRDWWARDYFVADPAAHGMIHAPAPYRGHTKELV